MPTMNKWNTDVVRSRNEGAATNRNDRNSTSYEVVRSRLSEEEIKSFRDMLKNVNSKNGLRMKKVRRCSRLISNGSYETEERLEELAERLLDELL